MEEREIWIVNRPLYAADYAKAFRSFGFRTRLVERTEADRAGLDGPAPLFVVDTNLGAMTCRLVTSRGIPYVGAVLDHWYFSPDYRLRPQDIEMSAALRVTPFKTLLDWNFTPDSPLYQRGPAARRDRIFVFTLAPEQVSSWKSLGMAYVEHLQMGVDPERFRPMELSPGERARHGAAVGFVGSPLLGDRSDGYMKLQKGFSAVLALAPDARIQSVVMRLKTLVEEAVQAQARDLFRFSLPQLILDGEIRHRVSFFEPGGLTPLKESWAILTGAHIAMLQRVEMAKRLARRNLAVWGSEAWRLVDAPGLDYRGPADWESDLPAILNATGISLNLSKLPFPGTVGARVFEVLSCGGFLLSNRYPGIEALFEDGREVVYYDDFDDLDRKVLYYKDRPGERREIGLRGRAAVLARHTWRHYAGRILEVLAERGVLPESRVPEAAAR